MIQPISAVGEKNNFLFESYIFILNISLLLSDFFSFGSDKFTFKPM